MSEAFLVAAVHRQDGAAGAVHNLLGKAGLQARRVAELHWLLPPDDDGAWLLQARNALGFSSDLPAFGWPDAPLLAHYLLHGAARSIQAGQRELVLLGQFTQPGVDGAPQAAAVLLASPAAVGRYNLAPRARLAALLAFSSDPDGLVCSASLVIQRLAERERAARRPAPRPASPPPDRPSGAGQLFMNILPEMLPSGDLRSALTDRPEEVESEPERFDLPTCDDIAWLASEPPLNNDLRPYFARARWLAGAPHGGALQALNRLITALEARTPETQPETWGALLSSGPLGNGLATLLERT